MKELLICGDVNMLLGVKGEVVLMEDEDTCGLMSRKYFSNKFGTVFEGMKVRTYINYIFNVYKVKSNLHLHV